MLVLLVYFEFLYLRVFHFLSVLYFFNAGLHLGASVYLLVAWQPFRTSNSKIYLCPYNVLGHNLYITGNQGCGVGSFEN